MKQTDLKLEPYLYGRDRNQVRIGLGQRLRQLQVQHTTGHRPHPPQSASPLLVCGARRRVLWHTSCLVPSVLANAGGGWVAQCRPATRWICLLTVSGLSLILVDCSVEDSPVHHLWLLRVTGRRLDSCPCYDLSESSTEHNAELRGLQQTARTVRRGVFTRFGAI